MEMSDFNGMIPINKTAALVTQKASKNNAYEPKNKDLHLGVQYWDAPRVMIDPPSVPEFKDFTSLLFGRMLVIGYLGNSRWQCKCQCGKYFARKTRVLSRGVRKDEELCYECYQFTRIKKNEYYRKTGKYPPDNYDYFK